MMPALFTITSTPPNASAASIAASNAAGSVTSSSTYVADEPVSDSIFSWVGAPPSFGSSRMSQTTTSAPASA